MYENNIEFQGQERNTALNEEYCNWGLLSAQSSSRVKRLRQPLD